VPGTLRTLFPVAAVRTLIKLLASCALAGVLVAGLLFPVVGGVGLLSNRAGDTVDSVSAELAQGQVPTTSVMLDAAGNTIATFFDQRRTPVPSSQISEAMKLAIVSIEDKRYYDHQGVDWRGTMRAFANNASGGGTQGASTLTQQYVKNYLLLVVAQNDAERRQAVETTPARKLREIRIALALDKELGKDEILTRYLNIVPFGTGAYGVQEAAQTYFGVNAADLTVPQAAMLAGMVQSSSVTPYTNPNAVLARRNLVIETMQTNNIVTPDAATAAKATPLGVLPEAKAPNNGCIAAGDRGFFCDYAKQYLINAGIDQKQLTRGGYVVKTTLDPQVQDSVKKATNLDVPANKPQVANVMDVVQPGQQVHKVLAMASSRTYGLDGGAGQTVQPQTYTGVGDGAGSVFKIFTTAAAMAKGMGTNTVLPTPQRVEIKGFGVGGADKCPPQTYCVQNFNTNFQPQYTVTDALAQSPNTTFVNLIAQTGVTPTVDMAVNMGMRSLAIPGSAATKDNPNRSVAEQVKAENSASFTLGVNQVNMVELANSAATLASGGVWCPPTPIESVTGPDGKPVTLKTEPCAQVIPAGLANTLANAMSKDDINGTSADAARTVGWTFPTSGKTGTTETFRSATFLGFTSTMAAASSVYDDSPRPQGIRVAGFAPSTCGTLDCGTITGGTTPAHTWYSALRPVIEKFGPMTLPPTDPKYVNGFGQGNVPSVVGQTLAAATKALETAGFKVTQSSVDSAATPGSVVRQSITGASIPGAPVTLYLSNGSGQRATAPSGPSGPRTLAPPPTLPPLQTAPPRPGVAPPG